MSILTLTRRSVVLFSSLAFVLCIAGSGHALQQPQAPQAKPVDVPAPPDVAAPPADAEKTKSGLASKLLTPGTGTEHPAAADKVTVNYTGWTTDGTMFDSTIVRGRPSSFQLNRVIPGWTEGVQLMVAGEKRRFWVPEKLAFAGMANKPKGMCVFDIELVEITPGPRTPSDVSAPPSDAQKTRSGLASKVIKPGTGTRHPAKSSTVTVHYSGWTTDGKMFDSSVLRGEPAKFPLDRVIQGWTEGVQLMVEGETRRLWIPEKLAYGGQDGKPTGREQARGGATSRPRAGPRALGGMPADYFAKEISSTSNTSMPFGLPSWPAYASFSGIQKRRTSPAVMSCTPSVQPAMTLSSGNCAGTPRATELSNILPSVVQPE